MRDFFHESRSDGFETVFSRSQGLASQANTCHRFAVKEEPSKLSSIGQKPVPTEINHNFNFSAAKLNSQSRCGVAPERRTARADFR
jgi:hypothetical protein